MPPPVVEKHAPARFDAGQTKCPTSQSLVKQLSYVATFRSLGKTLGATAPARSNVPTQKDHRVPASREVTSPSHRVEAITGEGAGSLPRRPHCTSSSVVRSAMPCADGKQLDKRTALGGATAKVCPTPTARPRNLMARHQGESARLGDPMNLSRLGVRSQPWQRPLPLCDVVRPSLIWPRDPASRS